MNIRENGHKATDLEQGNPKLSILDAAEELMARKGYKGTSIRNISDAAGVNVAMISYYFGSMERLLRAIIARHCNDLNTILQEVLSEDHDPYVLLRNYLDRFIEYSFDHSRPLIIAVREVSMIKDHPEILGELEQTLSEIRIKLVEMFEKVSQSKKIRNPDTELYVLTFSSAVETTIVNMFLFGSCLPLTDAPSSDPEQVKERLKRHLASLLELVFRGD